MDTRKPHTSKPLDRYLSVIDVWAMAFGCMVGWGVFAMPGTTFLPVAGPLGTMLSMLIGMIISAWKLCRCPYCGRPIIFGALAVSVCPSCHRDLKNGKKVKKSKR